MAVCENDYLQAVGIFASIHTICDLMYHVRPYGLCERYSLQSDEILRFIVVK